MNTPLLLAVAGAGAVGAVTRVLLVAVAGRCGLSAPWAVALVNLIGCFGFGVCHCLGSRHWSPAVAAGVLAGFFGAFTTFSAFAFDTHQLLLARRYALLFANLLLQNGLGFLALAAGLQLGRSLRPV